MALRHRPLIVCALLLAGCGSGADPDRDLAALKGAPAPAEPARERPAVDWAGLGDCRTGLRALRRLAERGELPDDDPGLPFGVIVGAPLERDRLTSPAIPIATDLPIPINDAAARAAPCVLQVGLAEELEVRRRIVGEESVASEYQTGSRREPNPAYEIAKVKVERAKRSAQDEDEIWTGVGDPMMDMIGLLVGSIVAGFNEGEREEELHQAMLDLAKTPRYVDQPVYAPYHFDRLVVDAAKRALIPIALIDRRRGTTERTTLRHTEQRRFYIPEGMSRRDRYYAEHAAQSISNRDLTTWLRAPPELPLTRLVEAALGEPGTAEATPGDWRQPALSAGGGPRTFGDEDGGAFERMLADLAAPGPYAPTSDPPGAEPDPERLAPAEAVGEPDLIRIGPDQGPTPLSADFGRPFRATGRARLVERPAAAAFADPSHLDSLDDEGWQDPYAPRKRRPSHGQAADTSGDPRFSSVVMVRNGRGLGSGFYVGPHLVVTNYHVVEEATAVDLSTLDGTTVVGVVIATDVGRDLALVHTPRPGRPAALHQGPPLRPGLEVEAIGAPHGFDFSLTRGIVSAVRTRPALLAPSMQRVRYVQTDAAINRGNSGGPLFQGDRVIGVNAWADADAASGGLNFAIHADEVRAFLEEEGIRPGAGD